MREVKTCLCDGRGLPKVELNEDNAFISKSSRVETCFASVFAFWDCKKRISKNKDKELLESQSKPLNPVLEHRIALQQYWGTQYLKLHNNTEFAPLNGVNLLVTLVS